MKPRQISIEFHEPMIKHYREGNAIIQMALDERLCRKALQIKRLQWQLKRRNFNSTKTSQSKNEDQTHEFTFIATSNATHRNLNSILCNCYKYQRMFATQAQVYYSPNIIEQKCEICVLFYVSNQQHFQQSLIHSCLLIYECHVLLFKTFINYSHRVSIRN